MALRRGLLVVALLACDQSRQGNTESDRTRGVMAKGVGYQDGSDLTHSPKVADALAAENKRLNPKVESDEGPSCNRWACP